MKLTQPILKEMVKQQLFERRVNLSAYKEANFGRDYVQLMGKAGMLKLTKKDVHALAKFIRSKGGAAGMGWSFTAFEGKLKENGTIKFSKEEMAKLHKDGKLEKDGHTYTFSEGKLTEAKDEPKVGDKIALVVSSQYVQTIVKVSGSYIEVDNKKGRKAPAVILGKKKGKFGFYNPKFRIKINNLKKIAHGLWGLKKTRKAIDGKDLDFEIMGRGQVFGFVNEGKLNEGKVVRLPSGHKVKVEFKGLTFSATRGKDVFLDRDELQRFFKATRKYLYK